MDILEHLGMKVPDIEGHGVIISRASVVLSLLLAASWYRTDTMAPAVAGVVVVVVTPLS